LAATFRLDISLTYPRVGIIGNLAQNRMDDTGMADFSTCAIVCCVNYSYAIFPEKIPAEKMVVSIDAFH
jgi:hypothetical protein